MPFDDCLYQYGLLHSSGRTVLLIRCKPIVYQHGLFLISQ